MSIATGPAPSSAPTADSQAAKIFEWRRGFNAMHLIDIGIRLGLFRADLAFGAGGAAATLRVCMR